MIVSGVLGRIAPGRPASHSGASVKDVSETIPRDRIEGLSAPGLDAAAISGWTASEGKLSCLVAGNLDWFQVELADLQLRQNPAEAVIQAYQQYGDELLDRVGGRFVLCVWDSDAQTGIVAHDRFGKMALYWSIADDGTLVFAPMATWTVRMAGRAQALSEQALFNYLYFHMVPSPGTIFRGVNKLMAAHVLSCKDGHWQPSRYWEPTFRETADASMSDAGQEMLGLLASSVGRLADSVDTGAFLSGGLDSSTVSGLLAKNKHDTKTYSIGFDAEGYDEIAYARIASERFGTQFHTYYVTPDDVLDELPQIAAAYDEPFGNSSALPAYFCARLAAQDGRQRLLAGDGGDELFAGNERYAKQTIFEYYDRIPGLLRQAAIEPVLFKLLGDRAGTLGKAQSYIRQAKVPLPDRLQTYNFVNRLGAEAIVDDALLSEINSDLPGQLGRDIYHHPASASRLNRMLYLDWHHTLADNDLRKVNRMCELAGIEVEYPMLDDRLVEFSTRVSSSRKMRFNRLRDFYKRAVAGFLPGEIIDKPKHGFGLPFGVWMEQHPGLQSLAGDNLMRMKRRGYVRPAFIDELLRLHREQHAGYYGEFIWALTMLELWLTAQGMEP